MAAPPITYVRHAMAVQEESVHPTAWRLDARGRAEADALANRLEIASSIGVLVTSTEPKARETAEAIGRHWHAAIVADERLREASRPWVGPGYRAVVHRYLRGQLPAGWEPHDEVAARVGAAVDDATSGAGGRPVVVVSHGLALALHLGQVLGDGFDRESFWSSLAFPDAWVLDGDGTLQRPAVGTPAT